MVSSDSERPSIEVEVKILNCSNNCQKFAPSGAIVAFRSAECMAVVGSPHHHGPERELRLHRHHWHPYLVERVRGARIR